LLLSFDCCVTLFAVGAYQCIDDDDGVIHVLIFSGIKCFVVITEIRSCGFSNSLFTVGHH